MLIFCLVFTGAMMFAEPASANAVQNQSTLRLNHADIEQQVRRNNPVIRNNTINEQGLNDMVGTPAMTNALIDGQTALIAMQAQTSAVLAQIMAIETSEPDPVRDGIIMSLRNDIASTERDIMQMSAQLDQAFSDPVRNSVSRGVMQIQNANRQIIWGVESMYLAYHTLTRQMQQTQESLESLDRNIEIMERRHAVGHVTARALQSVRATRTQLEAGITSMENELNNLKGQINLMLGRDFNAPLQIGSLPDADRDFLASRDTASDLRAARGSNSVINIARIDMDEQARQGGERARRQEAIARNTLESEERALPQRHESLSRAITDRLRNLELAEEQLEILEQTLAETQRRFDRGMVSRVDLLQAQSEVSLQEIRVQSADAELFGAIRRYEWFVRGLNI